MIGTDISAVQPGWVPPNCVFQIDDAQLDWTFREDYFDLVHTRYLYGAIDDWPRFYEQAYRHTRPGGWFEHVDFDLETRSENPNAPQAIVDTFRKWANLFFDAGRRAGRTFEFPREGRMEKQLAEAGFVDIEHRTWKLPIGGWPRDPRLKKIGMYNGMYIDQSLDGFAVYPIGETLGWTADEVTVLVSQMRAAIRDPKALPYFIVYVLRLCWSMRSRLTDVDTLPGAASPKSNNTSTYTLAFFRSLYWTWGLDTLYHVHAWH